MDKPSLANAMILNMNRQGWSLRGAAIGDKTMHLYEKDNRFAVLYFYDQTTTAAMEIWVLTRLADGVLPTMGAGGARHGYRPQQHAFLLPHADDRRFRFPVPRRHPARAESVIWKPISPSASDSAPAPAVPVPAVTVRRDRRAGAAANAAPRLHLGVTGPLPPIVHPISSGNGRMPDVRQRDPDRSGPEIHHAPDVYRSGSGSRIHVPLRRSAGAFAFCASGTGAGGAGTGHRAGLGFHAGPAGARAGR